MAGLAAARALLGVGQDCREQDVLASFRKLALVLHPDKSQQADAKQKFQLLLAAKNLLLKPRAEQEQEQRRADAQAQRNREAQAHRAQAERERAEQEQQQRLDKERRAALQLYLVGAKVW